MAKEKTVPTLKVVGAGEAPLSPAKRKSATKTPVKASSKPGTKPAPKGKPTGEPPKRKRPAEKFFLVNASLGRSPTCSSFSTPEELIAAVRAAKDKTLESDLRLMVFYGEQLPVVPVDGALAVASPADGKIVRTSRTRVSSVKVDPKALNTGRVYGDEDDQDDEGPGDAEDGLDDFFSF